MLRAEQYVCIMNIVDVGATDCNPIKVLNIAKYYFTVQVI